MASKMARALGLTFATLSGFACAEMKLKIMGQSGKFTLYDDVKGEAAGIMVTMDALKEVDSSGAQIGNTGSSKHAINSFATTAFTVQQPVDVEIGTANASRVDFEAVVGTIGKLKVETYMITSNGTVGDDNWEVSPGALKWNIVFPEWTFCAPCGSDIGAFLDLTITVQGLGTASKKGNSNAQIDLGGGANLMLSSQVTVDGNMTDMPDGYPTVGLQGSKTSVTFRFPKFMDNATYDPLITSDAAGADTTTTMAAGADSTTTIASGGGGTTSTTKAPSAVGDARASAKAAFTLLALAPLMGLRA